MAQVFTLDIHYRTNTFPALVTVRARGEDWLVHVHFLNGNASDLNMEDEVEFVLSKRLSRTSDPGDFHKTELLRTVRQAVWEHLKDGQVT